MLNMLTRANVITYYIFIVCKFQLIGFDKIFCARYSRIIGNLFKCRKVHK